MVNYFPNFEKKLQWRPFWKFRKFHLSRKRFEIEQNRQKFGITYGKLHMVNYFPNFDKKKLHWRPFWKFRKFHLSRKPF